MQKKKKERERGREINVWAQRVSGIPTKINALKYIENGRQ